MQENAGQHRFNVDDPTNPYRLAAAPHRNLVHKFVIEVRIIGGVLRWRVVQGICGPLHTVLRHPADPCSEWGAIQTWTRERQMKLLLENGAVILGCIAVPPMAIPMMFMTGRRAKHFFEGQQYYANNDTAGERWLLINGVGTTRSMQRMNAMQLADLFQREILCFHNPTQGVVLDLVECTMGRTLNRVTKVARKAAEFLRTIIGTYPEDNKFILLCHSQGTIITANAIEQLIKEGAVLGLHRLEIYTFGCAATTFFTVRDQATGDLVPFYEHYANDRDPVAGIGVLRDRLRFSGFPFPGTIFVQHREGHLFGEHYLPGIRDRLFQALHQPQESRLNSYLPK